ncbi:MAG TPA: exodeoxyribonuclease VII small subunit [Terriglobia bacterium]|nr:exodeoxyribonuclease VII small subunit [Terriglobia bacterium]
MAQTPKAGKPASFEDNVERLNAIIGQMEGAEVPLEQALQLYEEGMRLSAVCQKQLDEAEGRVEILRKRADGKMAAEPFEAEKNGESD